MLVKVLRYAFAASDLFVGLWLLVGCMNAISGVHMGITPQGVLAGIIALLLAVAMFAAAYAIVKNLAWQQALRTTVHLVLLLVFCFVFVYKKRHSIPDTSFETYAIIFFLTNIVGYSVWFHRSDHAKG